MFTLELIIHTSSFLDSSKCMISRIHHYYTIVSTKYFCVTKTSLYSTAFSPYSVNHWFFFFIPSLQLALSKTLCSWNHYVYSLEVRLFQFAIRITLRFFYVFLWFDSLFTSVAQYLPFYGCTTVFCPFAHWGLFCLLLISLWIRLLQTVVHKFWCGHKFSTPLGKYLCRQLQDGVVDCLVLLRNWQYSFHSLYHFSFSPAVNEAPPHLHQHLVLSMFGIFSSVQFNSLA